MIRFFAAYVCTAAVFFPIDLIWIGGIARDFYRRGLGSLMSDQPNIPVAVVFYILYAVGLTLFAVMPGLTQGSWRVAAMWGGLFSFFAYATYDLTNLATLKGFPWQVALVDMAWGTVLGAFACALGCVIARFVLERLGA
jgi:uncharacterized membrane protein